MEEKTEVEVIVGIKIGDKYLTLTEKAARELYAKLETMFAPKTTITPYPVYPIPVTPWYSGSGTYKTIPCENTNTILVGDFPNGISTTSYSFDNVTLL